EKVAPGMIRVKFTNDAYKPSAKPPQDRNLRVDKIYVNDVAYETENARRSGSGSGEWLYSNGYFQYQVK
ncbi:hypothetical protein MUP32_06010, partial [Candidatus Microgenomates bacterium]|nr:hypothetical protein [Candidatus Microgenomates bacterium]